MGWPWLLPLARSVTEAVRRACAEADAAGEAAVLQSLVGSCDAGPRLVYRPGENQAGKWGINGGLRVANRRHRNAIEATNGGRKPNS